MEPVVYHSTEWGVDIIDDGLIKANTAISPESLELRAYDLRDDEKSDWLRGICVTRSFYFARQFSFTIFALDLNKIRNRYRMIPRAEKDAYDLANNHGDFRLEAEEFVVCSGLSVDQYVTKIWLSEEVKDDPEYSAVINHPRFVGFFRQP